MQMRSLGRLSRISPFLLAAVAICVVPRAAAALTQGSCVQAMGGNSCTAGDVTFVLVGLGTIQNQCLTTSNTLKMLLGAQVRNNVSNTRYDIGMYVYDYTGSPVDPTPDAYGGLACARE